MGRVIIGKKREIAEATRLPRNGRHERRRANRQTWRNITWISSSRVLNGENGNPKGGIRKCDSMSGRRPLGGIARLFGGDKRKIDKRNGLVN